MNNLSSKIISNLKESENFVSNKQGFCPVCNEQDLEYGSAEFEGDNMLYFPWECKSCGADGEEWYSMSFEGHNVNTDEGSVEVTLNK